jgi:hypothetical protein
MVLAATLTAVECAPPHPAESNTVTMTAPIPAPRMRFVAPTRRVPFMV